MANGKWVSSADGMMKTQDAKTNKAGNGNNKGVIGTMVDKVVKMKKDAETALQNYGRNSANNTPPIRDVSGNVTKDYYGSTKFLNPFDKNSYK